MCMETVIKQCKLENDMTVYKVVRLDIRGDPLSCDNLYTLQWGMNVDTRKRHITGTYGEYVSYPAGFHSFRDIEGAEEYSHLGYTTRDEIIVECTIPANTKVTIGTQNGYTVYVSPVIIIHKPDEKKGEGE